MSERACPACGKVCIGCHRSDCGSTPCLSCEGLDAPRLTELEQLRARVVGLENELSHATAEEGDWLSKASRRMVNTVMCDRDALRQKVRDMTARIDALTAALRKFGRHVGSCDPHYERFRLREQGIYSAAHECHCGLDKMLDAALAGGG